MSRPYRNSNGMKGIEAIERIQKYIRIAHRIRNLFIPNNCRKKMENELENEK
jgi:hypothetical protein